MSADATLLLNGVSTVVSGLYPSVQINISKRAAANSKSPLGGWTEGYALPCFVISEGDAERIDDDATFHMVSVRYPVLVEYLKAGEAKVPGGKTPTTVVEDSDIRDIRAALRAALYQPALVGIANIVDITDTPKPVYETATTGGGHAVVSGTVFGYEMWEARPGNAP